MKYHEIRTAEDAAVFDAEVTALERCYAESAQETAPTTPEEEEEAEAAYEQSKEYFDRYIAGDR